METLVTYFTAAPLWLQVVIIVGLYLLHFWGTVGLVSLIIRQKAAELERELRQMDEDHVHRIIAFHLDVRLREDFPFPNFTPAEKTILQGNVNRI